MVGLRALLLCLPLPQALGAQHVLAAVLIGLIFSLQTLYRGAPPRQVCGCSD